LRRTFVRDGQLVRAEKKTLASEILLLSEHIFFPVIKKYLLSKSPRNSNVRKPGQFIPQSVTMHIELDSENYE
jgi:hypothetical protein